MRASSSTIRSQRSSHIPRYRIPAISRAALRPPPAWGRALCLVPPLPHPPGGGRRGGDDGRLAGAGPGDHHRRSALSLDQPDQLAHLLVAAPRGGVPATPGGPEDGFGGGLQRRQPGGLGHFVPPRRPPDGERRNLHRLRPEQHAQRPGVPAADVLLHDLLDERAQVARRVAIGEVEDPLQRGEKARAAGVVAGAADAFYGGNRRGERVTEVDRPTARQRVGGTHGHAKGRRIGRDERREGRGHRRASPASGRARAAARTAAAGVEAVAEAQPSSISGTSSSTAAAVPSGSAQVAAKKRPELTRAPPSARGRGAAGRGRTS